MLVFEGGLILIKHVGAHTARRPASASSSDGPWVGVDVPTQGQKEASPEIERSLQQVGLPHQVEPLIPVALKGHEPLGGRPGGRPDRGPARGVIGRVIGRPNLQRRRIQTTSNNIRQGSLLDAING